MFKRSVAMGLGLCAVINFSNTYAATQNYAGIEFSGMGRPDSRYFDNDTVHANTHFIYGHLKEKQGNAHWQYGWETGFNYIASNRDTYGDLTGYGFEGFFVADNNFTTQWHVFYKLGLGLQHLEHKGWSHTLQVKETLLYPEAKVGVGYQFKHGIQLSIAENYRFKSINTNPQIDYYGFYTSLIFSYAW